MTTTLDRPAEEGRPAPPPQTGRPESARATVPRRGLPAAPVHRPLPHEGISLVAVRGDLSASDGPRLARELQDLAASGARTLHVDLTAVTYVDGVIARLFLSHAWRLEKDSRGLLLTHVAPKVRRMLRWYGADYLVVR